MPISNHQQHWWYEESPSKRLAPKIAASVHVIVVVITAGMISTRRARAKGTERTGQFAQVRVNCRLVDYDYDHDYERVAYDGVSRLMQRRRGVYSPSMRLTQKQELLVARYLREVAAALEDVSAHVRDQALAQTKARIDRRLEQHADSGAPLRDEDVLAVLRSLGRPSQYATVIVAKLGPAGRLVLAADDRKWLGVCGGVAQYLGMDSTFLRAVFVLLGVTGPIVVLLYLGLYVGLYRNSEAAEVPRIDKARLVKLPLATLFAAVGLHAATAVFRSLVLYGYNRWPGLAAPGNLGAWDWLHLNAGFMLLSLLSVLLPLAVLSALPLSNGWDYTLKRMVQAALALYALLVSFGTAGFLVGLILHTVRQFGG